VAHLPDIGTVPRTLKPFMRNRSEPTSLIEGDDPMEVSERREVEKEVQIVRSVAIFHEMASRTDSRVLPPSRSLSPVERILKVPVGHGAHNHGPHNHGPHHRSSGSIDTDHLVGRSGTGPLPS
jgi:hypothetical protein